jgi:hypothetical protein
MGAAYTPPLQSLDDALRAARAGHVGDHQAGPLRARRAKRKTGLAEPALEQLTDQVIFLPDDDKALSSHSVPYVPYKIHHVTIQAARKCEGLATGYVS